MVSYKELADRDLRAAKMMFDGEMYNQVVRFCQQYIEKMLKQVIFSEGSTDKDIVLLKSHKVATIAKRYEEISGIKFTLDEIALFYQLTDYYFDTNYPGDDYVELSMEEAEEIYNKVLSMKEKFEL